MRYWVVLCCLTLALTACAANEQDRGASPPPDIDGGEGLSDTFEDGTQTDEEQLIEARQEFHLDLEGKSYSSVEAESLVRRHLNIDENSDTLVAFIDEENDKFIIRVYDTNQNKKSGRAGWYIVNPTTGEVQPYHKNK